MMNRPEPLLVVGGSADTLALLPRMGWRDLPEAALFALPLSGSAISDQVRKTWGVPKPLTEAVFDLSARFWFQSRPQPRPANAAARVVDNVDDEILALYRGHSG